MKKNICIFKNITGRTYTNAHITNSDMCDTIVNATCQYYSGNITLDMSDHRLIFFFHIQKNQNNVNCGNCIEISTNNFGNAMSKVTWDLFHRHTIWNTPYAFFYILSISMHFLTFFNTMLSQFIHPQKTLLSS